MREICHRSAGSVEGLVLREPLSIQLRAPNVWAALKCSNGVKDRHASRPPGVSHNHHYQSRIIKEKKKEENFDMLQPHSGFDRFSTAEGRCTSSSAQKITFCSSCVTDTRHF